ncbi:MAG: Spy/CpxP family protein refolding chaperone [Proteobacteria bacterium]|nr:Spy/CpxP family protein refolding chaperone [Pseudomonadota bacterium]
MKRWHVGIMVVLFLALTTTVFAFGHKGGFGPGGCGGQGAGFEGPMGMGMAANLNLSKEQIEKMWLTKEKFHNDTQKLRYELFQKRIELKSLYADPKADEATLLAKQKELNTLRQSMQDKMTQMRLEQRKILTPEQIKKLSETSYGPGFGRKGAGRGPCGQGAEFGPGRS